MVFYYKSRPEVGDYTIFMGLDKHEDELLIKYGFPKDIYPLQREKSINMKTRATPYVDKIINHKTEASRRLQCWQAGELKFQVLFPEYTDVVYFDRRSCTCRKWDLLGIPCPHGICALKLRRYDPHNFCEHWFSSDCYRVTYNDVIHATRDRKQWDLRSIKYVLPRVARRQPRRPKNIEYEQMTE